MATRKTHTDEPSGRKLLLRPRQEVENRIDKQIAIGHEQQAVVPHNPPELRQWENESGKWMDFTEELLRQLIEPGTVADEFAGRGYGTSFAMFGGGPPSFYEDVEGRRSLISEYLQRLIQIRGKVELWAEAPNVAAVLPSQIDSVQGTNKVFIVHGHDATAKLAVSNCLRKLGLEPIVLHEQANSGQTVVEKLLKHSAEVAFAVILLTADDRGASNEKPNELSQRARQNVVLELGLFIGCLGREKVCPLLMEGVEKPSDIDGIAYVKYEGPEGVWRYELARELRAAGLDADMNKL